MKTIKALKLIRAIKTFTSAIMKHRVTHYILENERSK